MCSPPFIPLGINFVLANPPALKKRTIDVAVISDVHLGTAGCHAEELLSYLSSIKPATLVLNGDIIDLWNFNKNYFPAAHTKVLKKILGMAATGTQVYYLTGNHDELLRRFSGTTLGNFQVCNKLLLTLDGKRAWIFHGDVFDHAARPARWLPRFGRIGYGVLMRLNRFLNGVLTYFGRPRFSQAGRIKSLGDKGLRRVKAFEDTVAGLAIENQYDYVVCGHIHHPKKEWVEAPKGRVLYMNAGDWVENLTALEYAFKRWKLYRYSEDKLSAFYADEELKEMNIEELIASIIDRKAPSSSLNPLKESEE